MDRSTDSVDDYPSYSSRQDTLALAASETGISPNPIRMRGMAELSVPEESETLSSKSPDIQLQDIELQLDQIANNIYGKCHEVKKEQTIKKERKAPRCLPVRAYHQHDTNANSIVFGDYQSTQEFRMLDHDHCRAKLITQKKAIQNREERVADLTAKNVKLETERDAATRDRDLALTDRDTATRQRDAAIGERDAAIGERDAATAARDAATTDRDAATKERDAARAERNVVTTERDTAKAGLVTAQAERDVARTERDTARAERDAIRDAMSKVQQERDDGRGELIKANAECDIAKRQLTTVKGEYASAKGELVRIKAEFDVARGDLVIVTAERGAARSELSAVKGQRDSARAEQDAHKRECDRVKHQLATAKAELGVSRRRYDRLLAANHGLERLVSELGNREQNATAVQSNVQQIVDDLRLYRHPRTANDYNNVHVPD